MAPLHDKLRILTDSAKYDASCASTRTARASAAAAPGICHSYTPDGRCISLLKILLTNYCIYDCAYCVNRASNDIPRARFEVDEVIALTLDFYQRNYVDGLFLSSGVIQSVDYTMERLVAVARTLRTDHAFAGYIHLKVMPGSSAELLAEAGRYADRVSANIELPTDADMRRLAPEKTHAAVEHTMSVVRRGIENAAQDSAVDAAAGFAPAGQTTQLIVGATDSSDREILARAESLYAQHALRRVYYTAYSPIPHQEALFRNRPTPRVREHRLYQADSLIRTYGFEPAELLEQGPDLDLHVDPKLAWALRHPELFPVDVNRAPRELLLRIPGFGRRTVARILRARQQRRLGEPELRRLGARLGGARHFIEMAGARPRVPVERLTAADFGRVAAAQGRLPLEGP